MKKRIYGLLLLITPFSGAVTSAQSITPSTLNSSGGSKTINGNTYEYSIGEMMLIHTSTSPNLVVTQGILQPMKVEGVGIADAAILNEELNVFPNPFQDVIYIRPNWKTGGQLDVSIRDVSGREILHQSWTLQQGNEQKSIQLNQLAAGTYLLYAQYIQNSMKQSRAYKIQKLN